MFYCGSPQLPFATCRALYMKQEDSRRASRNTVEQLRKGVCILELPAAPCTSNVRKVEGIRTASK